MGIGAKRREDQRDTTTRRRLAINSTSSIHPRNGDLLQPLVEEFQDWDFNFRRSLSEQIDPAVFQIRLDQHDTTVPFLITSAGLETVLRSPFVDQILFASHEQE